MKITPRPTLKLPGNPLTGRREYGLHDAATWQDEIAETLDGRHVMTTAAPAARYLVDGTKNALADLGPHLPGPGETLHAVMRGNYKLYDLLPAIIEHTRQPISRAYIATLGFTEDTTRGLYAYLANGQLRDLLFLVSHYFHAQHAERYNAARETLGSTGQARTCHGRTHCKVLALQTADGRHYVTEASANLNSCSCLEQYAITHSRELFEFHATWMERLYLATGQ